MDVEQRIKSYLRTLAPHVKSRAAALLLQQAVDEIELLRSKLENEIGHRIADRKEAISNK